MDTESGLNLLRAVKTGGAKAIVFAGGDPSIRPDIAQLVRFSKHLELKVEVQTNAHSTKGTFLQALEKVNLVGLSLDGPNAKVHDSFRHKAGNFHRVISLLRWLKEKNIAVMVRTIVAKPNSMYVPQIGKLIEEFPNVIKWSLLEFSPVGDGFFNRHLFELEQAEFYKACEKAKEAFVHPSKIDVFDSDAKPGTYLLVTPAGQVYGTAASTVKGVFPTVGSIIDNHLSELAEALPFSKENHSRRYLDTLLSV